MNNFNQLPSKPVDEWRVKQVIVFDWYDGPRHGIAQMAYPECEYVFDLAAEQFNPDDLDDRLFQLKSLPDGTVAKVAEILHHLGPPAVPVWIPVWQFPTKNDQILADEQIDELLANASPSNVVIFSRDMSTFLGCWSVDEETTQFPELLARAAQQCA